MLLKKRGERGEGEKRAIEKRRQGGKA